MPRAFMEPLRTLKRALRRRVWLFDRPSPAKIANLLLSLVEYGAGRQRLASRPYTVKIDISPLCGLRCPTCLHADGAESGKPLLEAQTFRKSDRMSVADFRNVIDQIKEKTQAVSLYYFGDPLMHPNLAELCGIARQAGLGVHMTSHLSYNLSDARIEKLATCGVTHLTVAVDGAAQEIYAASRIGGRLDWVLSNLQRIGAFKRDHGLRYPVVEVQYIRHPHHRPDEERLVRKLVQPFRVDEFTRIENYKFKNVVDEDNSQFDIIGNREKSLLPRCVLPFTHTLIKYNGDVIPCCNHRTGRQYANLGGEAVAGNIFEQPLDEIWNNRAYQDMRRLVADPTALDRDPSLKKSFCYGCPALMTRAARAEPAQSASLPAAPVLSRLEVSPIAMAIPGGAQDPS